MLRRLNRIMVTIAALSALVMVSQAGAADKLVIKDDAGSADVVKLTSTGDIVLPATGTNRGASFKNPGTLDNFGMVAAYPNNTGTNAGFAYQIIPKGTGYSPNLKAQLSLFNTDYVADSNNYEFLSIRGAGSRLVIGSVSVGTGVLRPLQFEMGGAVKMTLATNGYIGIGTSTPTSPLAVAGLPVFADNNAAKAGPPVLQAGDLYRTSTGQLMVVY